VLAAPLGEALGDVFPTARAANTAALVIVVVATTYASLIIGELVPKRLALQNAEALAARVALPMTLLSRFGRPVVWLLRASTNGVLRLLGAARPPASSVSEEEVKAMIAEGTEAGVFHREERRMLERVLRFADQPVRAIMVPRPEVVALSIDAPIDMGLGEAASVLGIDDLSAGDYATLAGLALHRVGEIPRAGETFEAEGWVFEVVDLDGRRIDKLLATPAAPARPKTNKA
jgi:CBS domain containing-hemolysin-like protein